MSKTIGTMMLAALAVLAAGGSVPASDGPDVRILDSIQNTYGPVTFDHRKHAQLAPACVDCHHEHSMAKGLPCKECHAITPAAFKGSVTRTFLACSSCHADADPANPGLPGLKTAYHKQCFSCHRGMGNIGTDPRGCTQLCHAKKPEKSARANIRGRR